jgi:arylsulfatase
MLTRMRLLAVIAMGLGVVFGYLAASGRLDSLTQLWAQEPAQKAPASPLGGYPVLPPPEQPFHGTIGRTAKDSIPDFPKEVKAPKGAPNVLLILTDDVGFGASSTFGGPVPTLGLTV